MKYESGTQLRFLRGLKRNLPAAIKTLRILRREGQPAEIDGDVGSLEYGGIIPVRISLDAGWDPQLELFGSIILRVQKCPITYTNNVSFQIDFDIVWNEPIDEEKHLRPITLGQVNLLGATKDLSKMPKFEDWIKNEIVNVWNHFL